LGDYYGNNLISLRTQKNLKYDKWRF
jgi:hypothetical protein